MVINAIIIPVNMENFQVLPHFDSNSTSMLRSSQTSLSPLSISDSAYFMCISSLAKTDDMLALT